MKILWLHQYFATPKGWGAVRTYEFARRFVKAGHEVDVVCCAGYDDSLRPTGHEPAVIDGVRVFVSGTAYRPHMGFMRRIGSFLCFMAYAQGFVVRRGGGYDVMIASSGPLTLAVPALIGRWFRGLPYVFEVIDVWPDSAIAAGVLKNPVLKWLSFRLEALAYRYAAAIVTCSTGMTERVAQKIGALETSSANLTRQRVETSANPPVDLLNQAAGQVNDSKLFTLSNCCDVEQVAPDAERRSRTRERLGVKAGQTVVLYTGAMGRSNAVEDLVGAVTGTADDQRIIWWFAGDGPEADKLKDLSSVAVCFFGTLPKEKLVDLYLAADVNVVTFMHAPLFYENSPNKFFDGIAAGLPAVFNRSTWLEPWLMEYDCGVICEGQEPGLKMAEAIRKWADSPDRRKQMARNARRLAEEAFDRDQLAAKYLKIVERVLTDGV